MSRYKLTEVEAVVRYDDLLATDVSDFMEAGIDRHEYVYVESKLLHYIVIQMAMNMLQLDDYPWRSKTVIPEDVGYRVVIAWPTLVEESES